MLLCGFGYGLNPLNPKSLQGLVASLCCGRAQAGALLGGNLGAIVCQKGPS